jgi:hypothetical protein
METLLLQLLGTSAQLGVCRLSAYCMIHFNWPVCYRINKRDAAAAAAETVRYPGAAWSLSFVCLIQLKLLFEQY